jgi:MFS family permease
MDASVLRLRPIRALLAAEVISTSGAQMTWIALPWFVLTTSGSATRMSAVITAEAIGLALTSLLGARLLHRVGARRGTVPTRRSSDCCSPAGEWAPSSGTSSPTG